MMMKQEDYERRSKCGNIDKFVQKMHDETGVPYQDIVKLLPYILITKTKHKVYGKCFSMYYFSKASIIDIHHEENIPYGNIEKYIGKAEDAIKSFLLSMNEK